MEMQMKHLLFAVYCGMVALNPTPANSQSEEREKAPPIQLEISTRKPTVSTYDIVPLRVMYRNTSDSSVTIPVSPSMPMSVNLYWEDPQGRQSRVVFLHPDVCGQDALMTLHSRGYSQGTVLCSLHFLRNKGAKIGPFAVPQEGE